MSPFKGILIHESGCKLNSKWTLKLNVKASF